MDELQDRPTSAETAVVDGPRRRFPFVVPAVIGVLVGAADPQRGQGRPHRDGAVGVAVFGFDKAVFELEPSLTRLDTLVVITPTVESEWLSSVTEVQERGVKAVAILVDPTDFGSSADMAFSMEQLSSYDIPTYLVKRGQSLPQALAAPVNVPHHQIPKRVDMGVRA